MTHSCDAALALDCVTHASVPPPEHDAVATDCTKSTTSAAAPAPGSLVSHTEPPPSQLAPKHCEHTRRESRRYEGSAPYSKQVVVPSTPHTPAAIPPYSAEHVRSTRRPPTTGSTRSACRTTVTASAHICCSSAVFVASRSMLPHSVATWIDSQSSVLSRRRPESRWAAPPREPA
jgi:hypothetical protein